MLTMREADRSREDVKIYTLPEVKAECFYYTNNSGSPCAAGYTGKKGKANFRYRYRSINDAITSINEFLLSVSVNQESDRLRRIEDETLKKDLFDKVEVGSIFVSSWGYEQTNVDAYQVIEKKGSATLVLREIGLITAPGSDHGNMSCHVIPVKDSFDPDVKPITKRVNQYGFRINTYSSASLWNGKDDYYKSWYA